MAATVRDSVERAHRQEYGQILATLDDGGSDRARLLLNDDSPLTRRVLALDDAELIALAIESIRERVSASMGALAPPQAARRRRSEKQARRRIIQGFRQCFTKF